MPYANNKCADQPAHPHRLISAFGLRCLDSITHLLAIAEISRSYLVSSAEQAGLSLNWSQTPKTDFLVTWLNLTKRIPGENELLVQHYAVPSLDGNFLKFMTRTLFCIIIPRTVPIIVYCHKTNSSS